MRKLYFFLASTFLCITFGFAQSNSLAPFHSISASGNVQIQLIKSNGNTSDYSITKGNAEDLVIKVQNGELVVKTKNKWKTFGKSGSKAKLEVHYTSLSSVDCSAGASVFTDTHITSDNMVIETSSGAKCSLLLKCKDLTINSSSGSSISLNGSSENTSFDASSGANISASELTTVNAKADASSGASIKLYAMKKLTADASSGGNIKYKGKPENLDIQSSVSGSVHSY